jgi:hypothetical protein
MFVLHNLSVQEQIGNDYVSIAPTNDARIKELISNHETLRYITDRFSDHFKRKVDPAIIIVNKNAPKRILHIDALSAFRNIIALLNISESWQKYLSSGRQFFIPNYSNYFDFYPISPSKDYKHFITWSPALHGLDEPKDFRGQTSPEISTSMNAGQVDSELKNKLLECWEDRFVKGRENKWFSTVLFRSLEMAYQASAVPFKNGPTIYDYGSAIALWVSAFEILVHPQTQSSSYKDVLELLGKARFNGKKLKNRYYSITLSGKKKKKIRVTLAQKLYYQMHQCRNDFIHGNPVKNRDLFPDKNQKKYPLNLYASVFYGVALIAFLGLFKEIKNLSDLTTSNYFEVRRLEESLLSALKHRHR